MPCYNCGTGIHEECLSDDCEVCHPTPVADPSTVALSKTLGGAPKALKPDEEVTDPHSTGRKRAVIVKPIDPTAPCEWYRKKNCGGGRFPITGCLFGRQDQVHHGPVKNTLNNNPENLHAICSQCHRRWHALNDPVYDEESYKSLPHNPSEATSEDITASEIFWKTPKGQRIVDSVGETD